MWPSKLQMVKLQVSDKGVILPLLFWCLSVPAVVSVLCECVFSSSYCVWHFPLREPTPPLLTPSQLEAQTLHSELPSLYCHDAQLSRLVYLRDTRDEQTRHSGSILSSALDSTVVRYLNDRSALDALRQPRWEGSPEAPQSSSPGSASRRLEGLRRRQPDDKLEKLKERIRRQREHLEEAVAVEARMGHLERPLLVANGLESTLAVPTAKVRKVAAAPPAPVYKGTGTVRRPFGQMQNLGKPPGLN